MTIDMTFERQLELSGQARYEEGIELGITQGITQDTRNTLKILIMNNMLQLPESVDIDSMTDEEVTRLLESLGTH